MLTRANSCIYYDKNEYLKRLISIVSLLVLSPTLIGCLILASAATNEPVGRHCDHTPISDVTTNENSCDITNGEGGVASQTFK